MSYKWPGIEIGSQHYPGIIDDLGKEVESLDTGKVDKTSIVNDLTTGGTAVPLSAEQGKVLSTGKVDKTSIVNNLTTGGTAVPLSAEQGKVLSTSISTLTGNVSANTASISELVVQSRPVLANGYADEATGLLNFDNPTFQYYCVTPNIMHVGAGTKVDVLNGKYRVRCHYYTSSGQYINNTADTTGHLTVNQDSFVRFDFTKISGAYMSIADIYNDMKFTIIQYCDKTPDIKISFLGLSGEDGKVSQNVHCGDASIIRFSNGKIMAVDFHRTDNYPYFVTAYRIRGIKRLDYICISHYHDDHVGNFAAMLSAGYINIDNATVFLPQEVTADAASHCNEANIVQAQTDLITALTAHNCTIVRPTEGQEINIDGAILKFYNTDHSVYNTAGTWYSNNYNDQSLCFNLLYGYNCINFSGDLGPIGQAYMAKKLPRANILKSMHHGWDNGANNLIPSFINNVSPEMVISINGSEHLPSNTGSPACILLAASPMQTWCERNNVPHYCTNLNGNIDVYMGKSGYKLGSTYSRYIRYDKNWKFIDNSTQFVET